MKLSESVQMGKPILIEDFGENIPSQMDALLSKNFTYVNGKKMVKIGDENYAMNDTFKLFITTKL